MNERFCKEPDTYHVLQAMTIARHHSAALPLQPHDPPLWCARTLPSKPFGPLHGTRQPSCTRCIGTNLSIKQRRPDTIAIGNLKSDSMHPCEPISHYNEGEMKNVHIKAECRPYCPSSIFVHYYFNSGYILQHRQA
jgi:hypothetical protein